MPRRLGNVEFLRDFGSKFRQLSTRMHMRILPKGIPYPASRKPRPVTIRLIASPLKTSRDINAAAIIST